MPNLAVLPMPAPTPADDRALTLSPVQAEAMARVETLLAASPVVALAGHGGSGRSTIFRAIAEKHDGLLLTVADFAPLSAGGDAVQTDTILGAFLIDALERTDLLILDDYDALSFGTSTTRPDYLATVTLRHLRAEIERRGKRLLIRGPMWDQFNSPSDIYGHHVAVAGIAGFGVADYAAFAANLIGADKAQGIDFSIVYRFASVLNGHQLRMACGLMAAEDAPDADRFIEVLQRHDIVHANTRTAQVEQLSLDALPGHEHIADRLMTNIILPLENRELAERLELRPKRGVLLYGPPGTGKTSIGRALAHRMKGKFFMIDGSFVSEPPGAFFTKVQKVVADAKANSPSVLFIDDADVLFQIDHIAGLARYLLSLLDGLESETASNVCVMMTAMDVRRIPEALLRSGRVELWLETKLPTEEARARILAHWMRDDLPDDEPIDHAAHAAATEGFTPADLRRLVGDARALYAIDLVRGRAAVTANAYIARATAAIVAVRARMAATLGDATLVVGGTPSAAYGAGIGGMGETGTCSAEMGW